MPKSSDLNFYLNDEDLDDDHLEESPNKRWNKLDSEITEQKLLDFDTVHLAIDTERGIELAWNEMIFDKTSNQNRFEDVNTLESIYVRIKYALDLLIKLDHSNFLRYYDYWFVNDESEAKIVVITEYSTAGSLKRALEKSKNSHIKVKEQSSKRWINQIVTAIKYLHSEKISLFQGHLNSEAIFIQNNGVLKVAPTLLLLNGVCEITQNTIKSSTSSLASNKLLTLSKEIIAQDLHAIGRIALDIYNSNFNFKSVHQSPIKSKFHANSEALRAMLNNTNNNENNITQEDNADDINDLQKDFINKCLSVNKSSPINIDTIWNHPFINIIYSLRVLSVFSIFNYFQGQAKFEAKKSNPKTPSLSKISEEKCQNNNESSLVESNSDQISNFRSTSNQSIRLNSTNSSFDKFKEKRKVSLTFLSSFNNLTLPQNFFAILDDIRYGLYPRIFKNAQRLW